MNNVLIPKNWFVVGLIVLVLVSLVFVPAVSASKPTHEISVEFADGNIGFWNELYFVGCAIKDANGKIVRLCYPYDDDDYNLGAMPSWTKEEYGTTKIDLSETGLNFDKPFQKILVYLILERDFGLCQRYDKITLDVTEYITSTDTGKNTFSFEVRQAYGYCEADRIDIFDLQGHRLLHFPKTDKAGTYGDFDPILTPAVSASEPTPEIGVEFAKGDIGVWNELYFIGCEIQDANGKIVRLCYNYDMYNMIVAMRGVPSWTENGHGTTKIDLSETGLNFDKPFQKILVYLMLDRQCGMMTRHDKITLDVTEYITSANKGKNTFSFEVKQEYGSLEADRIDIFDLQGHRLLHFPTTHSFSRDYGSFDPINAPEPLPEICVEFAEGNIGKFNDLFLAGYAIKDCDGYIKTKMYNQPPSWWWDHHDIKKIDLSKAGVNCNEPFKKVVLYFILDRFWVLNSERFDKITLDVTEYITSADKGKNTFSFEGREDYTFHGADEVDIFDLQGHRLLHIPATDDEGEFGSFDPIS